MARLKYLAEKHFILLSIISVLIISLIVTPLASAVYSAAVTGNCDSALTGSDLRYHLTRITGIADGLKGGAGIVNIYPEALKGYGYASPLFYPDLFMYFPAFLVYLGMPLSAAYYIFIFSVYFITIALFGVLTGKFIDDKLYRYLAIILFSCYQYFIASFFLRSAAGESVSLMFLIVILLGLYNMLEESFSKPYILLIGMLGTAYSHILSTVLAFVFVAVITLINIKKLASQQRFFIKVIIISVLFVLLWAMFFFPFLEIYFSDKFNFSQSWTLPSKNAFPFRFGQIGISIYSWIPALPLSILLGLIAFYRTNNEQLRKTLKFLLITVGIISFCTTCIFPWFILNDTLKIIQFPWRLNYITTPLVAILIAISISLFHSKKTQKILFTGCIVMFCAICVWSYGIHPTVSYDKNDVFNSVGAAEWLPLSEYDYIYYDGFVKDQDGKKTDYSRKENTTEITFYNDPKDTSYTLPLYYYKGYTANLINKDNTAVPLELGRDEKGHIKVTNINESGTIKVWYEGTNLQKYSRIITFSTLIGCIIFVGIKRVIALLKG